MRNLALAFLLVLFSGVAFAAAPELILDNNVQELYDSKITFRKIIRAFTRSKQCIPKESEMTDMLGLEYSFGCIFQYRSEWYSLSVDENKSHHLIHLDDATWERFRYENDELLRLRHKRRGYPQFRGSRPKNWFRYSTVAFKPIGLGDYEEIIRLDKEIKKLENEYREVQITLSQEYPGSSPSL